MGGSDIGSKYDFSYNCEEDVSDCYLQLIFQIASWTLLCLPVIIIAADVWSAFRKKKHWIPADSLVLGALALQLLGLLNYSVDFSGSLFGSFYHNKGCTDLSIFHYNWVSVVSGRVSVCVLMGCLLPGVARPLSSNLWSDMSALIISSSVSLFQISYEAHRLYTAFRKCGGGIIGRSEFVSMQMVNITILVLIIFLLLLLVCAALASASLRQIVSPKIPTIFFLPNCHTHFAWEKVGEHLTKSWIVIRTSDPQYIIARTCLTSSVALVITICNVIFIRQVLNVGVIYELGDPIQFGLRSGFIAMGSIVIYWRWITAVVYYPASLGWKWSNLSQYFQIEEFWESHLLGLIHESNGRGHIERRSCLAKLFMSLCRVMRLHKLLHVLLWIQMFSILFSKVCCVISQLFLSNKFFGRLLIRSHYEEFSYLYGRKNRREKQLGEGSDYDTYFKAIVNMQGENSAGLWIANQNSIRQIKKQMKKGEEEVKKYSELISFLRNKCSPYLIGEKCVKPRNDDFAILEVERELDVRKCSWKMTAVSLIAVILELFPFLNDNVEASNMVDRAIEACSQAWNIVEVVENYDKEAIGFAKAADKIFQSLKKSKKWLEYSLPLNRRVDRSPAAAKEAIENLVEKGKQIANQYSSRGWSDAMAGFSLYRVGGIIKNSKFDNVDKCFDGINSLLADVIGSCTVKATGVIMEDCKKLATMSEEEKVWKIARVAGKVKGVIENVGWKLKWSTDMECQFRNTSLQREEIRAFRKHPTFQLG